MSLAIIILAAGNGSRMKSTLTKVLHQIAGQPMINYVVKTASSLTPEKIVVVTSEQMDEVRKQVLSCNSQVIFSTQIEKLGTAHAVSIGLNALKDSQEILILYGDTPAINDTTLTQMLTKLRSPSEVALVMLGFIAEEPAAYGRLIIGENGLLSQIVEFAEANDEQKNINLCNAGFMAIKTEYLKKLLPLINNDNAKSEYYLTDLVALARQQNLLCDYCITDESEVMGVNTRTELAKCEAFQQQKLRKIAMENGATLIDPNTVTFAFDTKLGFDVTIHPHVIFGPGVTIENQVEIKSFSVIEGADIKSNVIIGPHARIRPHTTIASFSRIGNFVEIKNSNLMNAVKINHLSYIGDCTIGNHTNIGAGTITCNYDGVNKHHTSIGEDVFVGSNSCLIAPITIEDGALIAAGSVIDKKVPSQALAVARAKQINLLGKAKSRKK